MKQEYFKDETKENYEFEKFRHANKMIELKFQRENHRREHEQRMEFQRIKSAEIRKAQQRKILEKYR